MLRKINIKKCLLDNWLPKLISLALAVAVWCLTYHFFVKPMQESENWDIEDIRIDLPK